MFEKYGSCCGIPCFLLGIVGAVPSIDCQNNLLRTVFARLKIFQSPEEGLKFRKRQGGKEKTENGKEAQLAASEIGNCF